VTPPSQSTLPSTPVNGFATAPASNFPPASVSGITAAPANAYPAAPANGYPSDPGFAAPRSQAPSGIYASTPPLSRDWYVYQPDGRHLGPLSTTFLARSWLTGQIPRDVYVGAAGEPQWRPLAQVQEILEAASAMQMNAL
jgi:hypothetical protein